jgi:hypothetical protein
MYLNTENHVGQCWIYGSAVKVVYQSILHKTIALTLLTQQKMQVSSGKQDRDDEYADNDQVLKSGVGLPGTQVTCDALYPPMCSTLLT